MHKEYLNTECNADLLTVDYVAGNGSHSLRCRLLGIITLLLASLNNATASRIETIGTDRDYLISQKISYFGQLVKAYRYQDIVGTHALVMSRQLSPSSSGKNKTRLERIDLIAAHYTLRVGPGMKNGVSRILSIVLVWIRAPVSTWTTSPFLIWITMELLK